MKPSTFRALQLLREHESVTTHDLLVAGVGSRYSARIHELRHEHGYVISEERLKGDVSGSRYRLVAEREDLVGRQESRRSPGSAEWQQAPKGSIPCAAAPVVQQAAAQRTVVPDAISLAAGDDGALTPGLLFDPDLFRRAA